MSSFPQAYISFRPGFSLSSSNGSRIWNIYNQSSRLWRSCQERSYRRIDKTAYSFSGRSFPSNVSYFQKDSKKHFPDVARLRATFSGQSTNPEIPRSAGTHQYIPQYVLPSLMLSAEEDSRSHRHPCPWVKFQRKGNNPAKDPDLPKPWQRSVQEIPGHMRSYSLPFRPHLLLWKPRTVRKNQIHFCNRICPS